MIFVKFPYFNEPGFERQQGTSRGDESSRKYNLNIEQATLIHALYEQFKHPPPYFRDVIMRHFWLKKNDIIAQAEKWLSVNKVPTDVRSPLFEPGTPIITVSFAIELSIIIFFKADSESPIKKLIQELKNMTNPIGSLLEISEPAVASTEK